MKRAQKEKAAATAAAVGAIIFLCLVGIGSYYTYHRQERPLPAAVGIPQPTPTPPPDIEPAPTVSQSPVFHYIEVTNGCDWSFTGACVNMRAGPGLQFDVVNRLRTGVVLKVEATTTLADGLEWYKIIFDGEIRYPERVAGDWYVAADEESVRLFEDVGDRESKPGVVASTTKRIIVDRTEETLYAYDGDTLFMKALISTGLEFTPTPRGTFTVFKKTPSRYMQGPIPDVSDQYYDLPGVPWNLYFTTDGSVIHGTYWHNHFGEPWSHGCVNLPLEEARTLYEWADLGTPVTVQN